MTKNQKTEICQNCSGTYLKKVANQKYCRDCNGKVNTERSRQKYLLKGRQNVK